jgi:hypothetical protein
MNLCYDNGRKVRRIKNQNKIMPEERDEEIIEEQEDGGPSDEVSLLQATDTKFVLARRLLQDMRERIDALEALLDASSPTASKDIESLLGRAEETGEYSIDRRAIDGVFDGENMVGEDGRQYTVPPNYASKSKLVEGDLLRLTIDHSGRFIFKQKGPIERERLVGMLVQDEETREWLAAADSRTYRVLSASVSYFKGDVGDEVVILVPKNAPSKFAAIENIIRQDGGLFS